MHPLKELRDLFVPRRASTQTWMMLTFTLFVGLAVAGTGLYAFLVLRGEVREAARATLRVQAERIADQLETLPTPAEREALAREIARTNDLAVALATPTEVLLVVQADRDLRDRLFFERPEVMQALQSGAIGFDERTGWHPEEPLENVALYVALYRPGSNLIVRVGETAMPFLLVTRRMLATLAIGMALALVFALLGSWIAARKVTEPLRAISESAQRIDAGDVDAEIRVRTRSAEIQDLARSLNSMAERFRGDIGELQRVHQIQNEFIGNVSHEVKNPIFAVSGYLEALGSDQLPPDLRERYATKGLQNLQRLNNLFSDLIEIARLEYRADIIHPERFELQALLEEVGETVLPKAERKVLELTFANLPVDVWADRHRIRQVLTNLVENAVNYTDSGSVRVRTRQRKQKVRVEIVDTGRGIAEEHLDRVFERFFRVDAARSRKEGGTGLGLSIVKQILQAHGESVHVESTVGRGTRFFFDLPLADFVDAAQAPPPGIEDELPLLAG